MASTATGNEVLLAGIEKRFPGVNAYGYKDIAVIVIGALWL